MNINKLKGIFFKNPEKEYHIRELARLFKKSPNTISKELKKLEQSNILVSRKERGHILFKSNSESFEYRFSKIFYNILKIKKSGLINFLEKKYSPEVIIVFGSYARGENNSNSDIDLLVVTPNKQSVDLKKFELRLKTPIQMFIFSNEELRKLKNKELMNNMLNGIILKGFLEVFK